MIRWLRQESTFSRAIFLGIGMNFGLSFGQVEAVLAKLNRIADHKRVAFQSRLKHLQKNGCPRRDRPGRGKAGTFSFSQLMQIAIAVDLLQSGLPPALAARIVVGNFMGIRPTIYSSTFTATEITEFNEARGKAGESEMEPPQEWLWMISPEALREMTSDGIGEFDHYEAMIPVPLEDARRQLESGVTVGVFGELWRTLVIHGTRLTQAVMTTVAYHFRFATWDAMRANLVEEMEDDERRFREIMEEIEKTPPLSPEQREEFKRKFGDLRETDYSTNPPTPPAMVVQAAKEIIMRTDRKVLEPIAAEEGAEVYIDGPTMKQLLYLRLMDFNDEGIPELTHLGAVVNKFLRDPQLAKQKIGLDTSDPALGLGDY